MTNELTYLSPLNLRESGLTEDELKKIGAETAAHMKSQACLLILYSVSLCSF